MEKNTSLLFNEIIVVSKLHSNKNYGDLNESFKRKYLKIRESLLRHISSISSKLNILNKDEVFYLSIAYLDQIFCTNSINVTNIRPKALAISCFSLALKFIGDFKFNSKDGSDIFKMKYYLEYEYTCVQYLKHNLVMTTIYDYLKTLTIDNEHMLQVTKKIIEAIVYEDCFVDYNSATLALGVCDIAKGHMNQSGHDKLNIYQKTMNTSLSFVGKKENELRNSVNINKRNRPLNLTASTSFCKCDFLNQMHHEPFGVIDIRKGTNCKEDLSDSGTHSTLSPQSIENDREKTEKNTTTITIATTKSINIDEYEITKSRPSANKQSNPILTMESARPLKEITCNDEGILKIGKNESIGSLLLMQKKLALNPKQLLNRSNDKRMFNISQLSKTNLARFKTIVG